MMRETYVNAGAFRLHGGGIFALVTLFCITFVGNGSVGGLPLVSFVSVGALAFSLSRIPAARRMPVHPAWMFGLIAVFDTHLILNASVVHRFDYPYFMWPVHACLASIALLILWRGISELSESIARPKLAFSALLVGLGGLMLVAIFAATQQGSDAGRLSGIFGPNMWYRIILFLAVIAVYGLAIRRTRFWVTLLCVLTVVFGATALTFFTGSRGGLISAMILFAFAARVVIKGSRVLRLSVGLLLLFVVVLVFTSLEPDKLGRLGNFEYMENRSLYLRYHFLVSFTENFSHHLFSMGTPYHVFDAYFGQSDFPYPHNVVLELIYFYGIIGSLTVGLLVAGGYRAGRALMGNESSDAYAALSALYFVLVLGASASGDLSDNYIVLAFAIALLLLNDSPAKRNRLRGLRG